VKSLPRPPPPGREGAAGRPWPLIPASRVGRPNSGSAVFHENNRLVSRGNRSGDSPRQPPRPGRDRYDPAAVAPQAAPRSGPRRPGVAGAPTSSSPRAGRSATGRTPATTAATGGRNKAPTAAERIAGPAQEIIGVPRTAITNHLIRPTIRIADYRAPETDVELRTPIDPLNRVFVSSPRANSGCCGRPPGLDRVSVRFCGPTVQADRPARRSARANGAPRLKRPRDSGRASKLCLTGNSTCNRGVPSRPFAPPAPKPPLPDGAPRPRRRVPS